MDNPLVSVVLVVCNVERFLGEAIESILGQTFRDFEFVIVDFGSTDQSKEIVSRHAAKDRRIQLHEIPHSGLAEARNAACSFARGRYIAIMDADDVSLPHRLRQEVEFLEKNPKVGVVGGAVDWIDASGAKLVNARVPAGVTLHPVTANHEIQAALVEYNPVWQPSVLMRAEAFTVVGGYRGAFAPTEDYDLWLRIAERFEMANLDEVLLNYRIHPFQVSVRRRKQQTLGTLAARASASARRKGHPDPFRAVKEITPSVLTGLGISEARQQTALASEYRGWIRSLCEAGEWSGALDAGREMLKASDWAHLDRRAMADMRLDVARLYWKNHRFGMGIVAAGQAVITRPRVAGRPLRALLRQAHLAN
jgi:hypothetical protein